jgi:hypothetical protein
MNLEEIPLSLQYPLCSLRQPLLTPSPHPLRLNGQHFPQHPAYTRCSARLDHRHVFYQQLHCRIHFDCAFHILATALDICLHSMQPCLERHDLNPFLAAGKASSVLITGRRSASHVVARGFVRWKTVVLLFVSVSASFISALGCCSGVSSTSTSASTSIGIQSILSWMVL